MEPIIIDGKVGQVSYLDAEWRPTAPETSVLAKVLFDDGNIGFFHVPQARTAIGTDKSGNRGHKGRPGKVGGSGPSPHDLAKALRESTGSTPVKELHDLTDAMLNHPEVRGDFKLPKKMYHVTSKESAAKIEKEGLKVGKPVSYGTQQRGAYLTPDPRSVGEEDEVHLPKGAVVFEVDTEGLDLRLDPEYFSGSEVSSAQKYIKDIMAEEDIYAVYSKTPIPPSKIRRTKIRVNEWRVAGSATSGNRGHKGRKGQVGGSLPNGGETSKYVPTFMGDEINQAFIDAAVAATPDPKRKEEVRAYWEKIAAADPIQPSEPEPEPQYERPPYGPEDRAKDEALGIEKGPSNKVGSYLKGAKREGDDLLKSPEQKAWEKSLTDEDRKTLVAWTGDTRYNVADGELNIVNPQLDPKTLENVERMMETAPKFHGTVYRGTGDIADAFDETEFANAAPGKILITTHLASASREPKVAKDFVYPDQDYPSLSQGTLVKISLESGMAIEHLGTKEYQYEREVIIPKGRFQVKKMQRSPNGRLTYIELDHLAD
jgi:hypothetical protein